MTEEQRKKLVEFCAIARADLEGIDPDEIDRKEFSDLSDEALLKEADWLDDMLGK